MAAADFAYCLRHTRYDDVIEISTKIVEFCTLGVPPILNDNALNRALFGDDYPYLVDVVNDDIPARIKQIMGPNSFQPRRCRIIWGRPCAVMPATCPPSAIRRARF